MFPAVEKQRSDVTDVAGAHKYFLVNNARFGYFNSLFFHHIRKLDTLWFN